jgi:hypothetical protein
MPACEIIGTINKVVNAVNRRSRARNVLESLQLRDGVTADRVRQLQRPERHALALATQGD